MAKIIALLFLSTSLLASFPPEVSGPILYKMHKGECEKGMQQYLHHSRECGQDDFALLQEMCLRLLETGIGSKEQEVQLMCMFGAGIAANPTLIPVLQRGLDSSDARIQVVALHYLSDLCNDEADLLLFDALSSPFLLTRLEAAYELAKKKDGGLIEQLLSLYYKVPGEVRPLFAQIAAPLATSEATNFLERLLSDTSRDVRLAAIIESGSLGRDDLLERIRQFAKLPDIALQEGAITALAKLKDEECKPFLQTLAKTKKGHLQLAAHKALYTLGHLESLDEIEAQAKAKNLFAITLLGELPKEERILKTLSQLCDDTDAMCRLNAGWALLQLGATPQLGLLKTMLVRDEKDMGFTKQYSPGRSLYAWTQISGVASLAKIYPNLAAETLEFRGQALRKTVELPEEDFLHVARMLSDYHQYDLVPFLIELLVNHRSEKAIALLKEMQQKAGAPLIRNWANLALYKLEIPGPYEENLIKWVSDVKNHPIIRFREKEKKDKKTPSRFEFSPEETSQLLISAFETLATKQNRKGREALLNAIACGNDKNKYALAGLLMRMIE